MRKALLLLLPGLLAGATVLEAAKVRTQHDPKADFSSFQTYRWQKAEGPGGPELDGPVRAAANKELAERGLRLVAEGEKADLLLAYNAGFADVLVAGFSLTVDWWGQMVAVPGGDSNVSAGLLFLMTRPEGGEPVWAGALIVRGTTESALQIMRDRAPKYARKILSNYPPR